jgi:hypothetical protein
VVFSSVVERERRMGMDVPIIFLNAYSGFLLASRHDGFFSRCSSACMLTTITASAVDHDIIVILKPRSHGLRQLPCFPPP